MKRLALFLFACSSSPPPQQATPVVEAPSAYPTQAAPVVSASAYPEPTAIPSVAPAPEPPPPIPAMTPAPAVSRALQAARQAAKLNDWPKVRKLLHPLTMDGHATPDEADLEMRACDAMGDKACVADLELRYGL